MKKKIIILASLLCLNVYGDLLDNFGFGTATIDVVLGDQKEKDIRQLKTTIDEYKNQEQKEQEVLRGKADHIKARIDELDALIASGSHDQSIQQKLVGLQSSYQVLARIKSIKKDYSDSLKQHLALLEAQVNDDIQDLFDVQKTVYSFEDLQTLTRKIMSQEDKWAHLGAEKNEINVDLENSKKRIDITKKFYDQKLHEENELRKKLYTEENVSQSQIDLLSIETQLADFEYQAVLAKVEERTARLKYLTEAVTIENKKLQKLKKKRDSVIARALRVDKQDIESAHKKMNEQKQKYLALTDQYLQKIEYFSTQQEALKKDFHYLEERYADVTSDSQNLDEWTSAPATVQGYLSFVDRGVKKAEIALLDAQIESQRTAIELEKTKFKEYELNLQVVQSWYNIKHQKFGSSDKLLKTIADYQDTVAECSREKSMYDDKRYAVINRLNLQNRSLSNIKIKLEELTEKSRYLFRKEEQNYNHCTDQLQRAQLLLTRQIELTGHLIESYSTILVTLGSYEKQIGSTIVELQRASLWQRSGGAISREGLQNIVPDTYSFFVDVLALGTSYVEQINLATIIKKLGDIFYSPIGVFLILCKLLLCFILFLLMSHYGLALADLFLEVGPEYRGVYFFSRLAAVCLQFFHTYQWSMFLWLVGFYYVAIEQVVDMYPTVVFYLISIPYLIGLIRLFINFVIVFNKNHDYQLFRENFEDRFNFSIGIFLYASVLLLFFREAFIAATYIKSELPGILLAFYSIIVRVLFLSLIRKEDLLAIIPSKNVLSSWITSIVDKYYYALLGAVVTIMILSDPHIGGYDNLIVYLLWGIGGTILTVRGLFLFYAFVRRTSSYLFFSLDEESIDERFQHAKTWYGILVICIFAVFLITGAMLVAWCWGKSIPLNSLSEFFSAQRLSIGFTDGQYQKVSIIDLIRTFLFIPASFLVAYLVDKFVLHRIYMILLVDPGVHNAVSTISYYLVVISVITLGLCQEGFGFLVAYYILQILFGMEWAVRDVFNDFVAYFVLLIQRPVKVGDYIKISDEVKGVVRKITPRTVVLRREQSYHLIIPNSKLMQEVILNWDYTRSFIAFPDIQVGVRYSNDPEQIKKILSQAVDSVLNVLKIPPPVIRLDEFSPSGYVFMVRGFVSSEMTLEQWNIASDVRLAIVKALHKNNIELAYPVRIIRTIANGTEHQYLQPGEETTKIE
jgi:small-conductance mechanosensitive channel